MYDSSRSAVLLDGERSESFDVEQGVAQGCSLSPILFSVFFNGLLREVEEAEIGIDILYSGKSAHGAKFPHFLQIGLVQRCTESRLKSVVSQRSYMPT